MKITVTHQGSRWGARFRAPCLVWRVLAAFPVLVRMRFLFVFSSLGHHLHHYTDVPLQPDSPLDNVVPHTTFTHKRREGGRGGVSVGEGGWLVDWLIG